MSDRTVLCVDDESNVLSALVRLFRKEDYRFLTAGNGAEALARLTGEHVQVVIADQRMPGMSGLELLQRVKRLYPDTVRVVLSGTADVNVVLESINQGEVFRFITKPWNDEELKVTIRQCLSQYDLVRENRNLVELVRSQIRELRRMNTRLGTAIEERAESLRCARAILERLEMPVIAISQSGNILLANAAARTAIPALGASEGTLPLALREAIGRFDAGGGASAHTVRLDDREIRVRVEPLEATDAPGGRLLLLG
jgi:response regulator RpfG family c-di-GMP phosphodiesterase